MSILKELSSNSSGFKQTIYKNQNDAEIKNCISLHDCNSCYCDLATRHWGSCESGSVAYTKL